MLQDGGDVAEARAAIQSGRSTCCNYPPLHKRGLGFDDRMALYRPKRKRCVINLERLEPHLLAPHLQHLEELDPTLHTWPAKVGSNTNADLV